MNSLDSQISTFPAIHFQLMYKCKFKKCTCWTRLFQRSSIYCWLSLSHFQMEYTLVSSIWPVYVMVNVADASLSLPCVSKVLKIYDLNFNVANFYDILSLYQVAYAFWTLPVSNKSVLLSLNYEFVCLYCSLVCYFLN